MVADEDRLGYPVGIYERQKLLQALYNQLKHKEKILVNKKVMRIEHKKDCVEVVCGDGTSYVGDIVIGADGVHSKVRQEMQRIGNTETPGSMDTDDESKFKCKRYNAVLRLSCQSSIPPFEQND